MIKVLVLKVQYDGTDYSGWQIQPASVSIQGKLEKVLFKLFKHKVKVIGSGRTDAGVHSLGQIASIELDFDLKIPESKLKQVINGSLPKDINIEKIYIINEPFNARFDAIKRDYVYHLMTKENALEQRYASYVGYDISLEKLNQAAQIFIGRHNFTTFSKLNSDTINFNCNLEKCEWTKERDGRFKMLISSCHFVYGQVRALVGVMIDYARGKRTLEDLQTALDSQDRLQNSPFAPAEGLILNKIYYPDKFGIQ